MKKKITIVIDINNEQEKILDDIRWKHIDVDSIVREEMEYLSEEIISSVKIGRAHV